MVDAGVLRSRAWLAPATISLLALSVGVWHLARSGDLPRELDVHGGKAIYEAACVACHGTRGEGTPQAEAGFDPPSSFPHFNKCDETTPEFTRDYKAAIRDGGPARGFSTIMPSFSGVLTSQQMDEVIAYLRSLCKETGWPVGELNVPRALLTEKAFPESETVLTTTVNAKGAPGISNELVYEQVLAKYDQLEVAVPFSWVHKDTGGMTGGLGDIAIGDKHVLYSHLNANPGGPAYEATGSILSVQGEVVLATGDQRRGLGAGEPSLGVFAMYDQLLPGQVFLQFQPGIDIPRHTEYGPRSAYLRTAFGKSFSGGDDLGRLWSPMIEIIGNRDLTSGTKTDWDVVPEFQVTLNRRQHVRAAMGYRLPINDTAGRPKQFMMYFLWDWFDGGLFEGW
ncbi:MAG: cytochrome c, class [Gammaproteobacteria bacterium]|nr:cytochrome c, class [Gammaproteobacteria bacterium]